MRTEAMIKCLVNGKIISLTKTGYEMAKEYYGAVKIDELELHEIPIELRKPLIIPSKPLKVEQKLDLPIEIQKTMAVKEIESETEVPNSGIESKAEPEQEVAPAKTIVRRPRKGGKK